MHIMRNETPSGGYSNTGVMILNPRDLNKVAENIVF